MMSTVTHHLKQQFVIIFCGFFISLLTDGVRFSFGLTYKELLEEFNKGRGATAGIGSLMFSVMNFSAPLSSVIINKYGCRMSTILGAIVYAIGLTATSLTPNFYFLYGSFGFVCGIGFSLMYVPVSVIIQQYFDKKKSLANGIAMCGSGVGGFLFNPLLSALFDTYTWRGGLLVCAGIILNGAVAGTLMKPVSELEKNYDKYHQENIKHDLVNHMLEAEHCLENVKDRNSSECHGTLSCVQSDIGMTELRSTTVVYPEAVTLEVSNTEERHETKDKTILRTGKRLFAWHILKDPKFIFFMISQFFLSVAHMIPFTYLPEFVISLGYSHQRAVWLMSSISIVSTISRVAYGWLADRKFINRRVLYCAANFTSAFAVGALFFMRHYVPIMTASLVYAMSTGCTIAIIAIVVSDLFGSRLLSDAYGLYLFGRGPGNLLGPPFSGWIIDKTGTLGVEFIVSGLTFALGGVFMIISVKTKKRLKY